MLAMPAGTPASDDTIRAGAVDEGSERADPALADFAVLPGHGRVLSDRIDLVRTDAGGLGWIRRCARN
jgi:hypothetical protein